MRRLRGRWGCGGHVSKLSWGVRVERSRRRTDLMERPSFGRVDFRQTGDSTVRGMSWHDCIIAISRTNPARTIGHPGDCEKSKNGAPFRFRPDNSREQSAVRATTRFRSVRGPSNAGPGVRGCPTGTVAKCRPESDTRPEGESAGAPNPRAGKGNDVPGHVWSPDWEPAFSENSLRHLLFSEAWIPEPRLTSQTS